MAKLDYFKSSKRVQPEPMRLIYFYDFEMHPKEEGHIGYVGDDGELVFNDGLRVYDLFEDPEYRWAYLPLPRDYKDALD